MNVAIYSMREVKQTLAAFAIFALLLSLSQGIFVSVASAAENLQIMQAQNGGVGKTTEDPVKWTTGNVVASKGHYVEGQSVAYMITIPNLTPGVPSTLVVGFDVTHSGKMAIDYLTSNDRIEETVDPCSDTSICVANSIHDDTIAIPAPSYSGSLNGYVAQDVLDSFNELVAIEGTQYMKIWNGNFDSIGYTTQADISLANSEAQVTIGFTPDSDSVVISWGGHISSSLDYPGESAVTLTGSPYHMRLIDLDGKGGNQDLPLAAGAVPPSGFVNVVKHVVGGTAVASDFSINASASTTATPDSFLGSETGTIVAIQATPSGNDYVATPYIITEVEDPEYIASYSPECSGTIAPGATTTCTITNTFDEPAANLTLVKVVSGGSATADQWTLKADGSVTDLEGTSGVSGTVTPGDYTLSEFDGPVLTEGQYQQSAWQCTGATALNGDVVTISDDETVVCTVTNTYIPPDKGTLTIVKNLVQDNGGTEGYDDFSFTFDGGNTYQSWSSTSNAMSFPVDPGFYTVSEDETSNVVVDRYTVSYNNGNGCTNLEVVKDQETICTITNDDITPELTVVKHVVDSALPGDKNAEDFEMTVTGTNVSNTAFAGSEAGVTVTLDANAQYSVSETDTFGYIKDASDANCSSVLDLGEKKTCTIKNTEPDPTVAYVKFTKVVVNDFGGTATSGDFTFEIGGDATVTDIVSEEIVELPVGDYTATESDLYGYELDSITGVCDSSGNFSITSNDLGSTVECTFTNSDIQPKLTLVKIVNGGKGTTSDFTLNVGNTQVVSGETNGFNAGQYTISESFDGALGNYTPSFSGACDGTNSVDLKVGDDVTCTITNNAYTVTGFKWHDEGDLVNNLAPNGEFDQNEKRLEGWQITATEVGGDIIMATTSPSGYYELALGAGEWTISEVLQGGWIQTGLIVDGATSTDTTCTFVFDEQTQDFERTCSFGNHLLRDAALSCDVFTATPNSNLAPGTEVTLEWETSDAHVVSIDNGIGFVAKDGSATTTVASDTVFTLTAQRLNDSEQVTDEVTCQVLVDIQSGGGGGGGGSSSPRCTAFDLNGGVLSWETRHGTSLSIEADGTEIFSSDDDDVVDEGTFELVGNTDADFELTVKRGSRSDTCIIAGPEGEVLGEQVSVVPLGAADTGAGGTSPLGAQLPQLLAVFTGALRVTRNGK